MTYTGNLINGIQETLKLHIKNSELNILQTQSNIIRQHLRGTHVQILSPREVSDQVATLSTKHTETIPSLTWMYECKRQKLRSDVMRSIKPAALLN